MKVQRIKCKKCKAHLSNLSNMNYSLDNVLKKPLKITLYYIINLLFKCQIMGLIQKFDFKLDVHKSFGYKTA